MCRTCTLLAVAAFVLPGPARAGLYDPAEPTSPLVTPRGVDALPFPLLRDELNDRLNIANTQLRSPLRQRYLDRQQKLLSRGLANLSPTDLASLGECRLRLREADAAVEALKRAEGLDRGNFWVTANLAAAYQQTGQVAEAAHYQEIVSDLFPKEWPGNAAAGDWFRKAERYQLKLLRLRTREAGTRPGGRTGPVADVDDLFGVRFGGPDGAYAVGQLDAAEKAKLPADAAALVQQLLLWQPEDARLLWLLGEIANATGDAATAGSIFDDCLGSRRFDAPTLRSHRQAVREVLAAQAAAIPPPPAPASWVPEGPQVWAVGGTVAVLLFGLAYLQVREVRRRRRLRAAGRDLDCNC